MSSAANPISVNSPGSLKALWLTIRPKTLSAAIVPVLVATALVYSEREMSTLWISIFAILSTIFIQVGTNFVNDALDFVKGADRATRMGEARATQQGWFTANQVLLAGVISFFAALLFGVPLVLEGGWPIVIIGLISLLMGYAYTGGPWPLAYVGLGDVFVLLFFGLVAVGGVYFLHAKDYVWPAFVAGLQVGSLATVLIAINNLRDLDQDREVNKKTMAVRLGPRWGRLEVPLLFAVAFGCSFFWLGYGAWMAAILPCVAMPIAIQICRELLNSPAGRTYNRLLARAAFVHMLFGVLLSIGLIYK